jgi:hypothetical protein
MHVLFISLPTFRSCNFNENELKSFVIVILHMTCLQKISFRVSANNITFNFTQAGVCFCSLSLEPRLPVICFGWGFFFCQFISKYENMIYKKKSMKCHYFQNTAHHPSAYVKSNTTTIFSIALFYLYIV